MEKFFPALFPITFFGLLALERLLPGRPQPEVKWWYPKAIAFFLFGATLNGAVGGGAALLLKGRTLLDLSRLGTLGGALAALLLQFFLVYWVHRAYHRVGFLWRWVHQLHHSGERVDIAGFAYAHPFQILVVFIIGTGTTALLGVTPAAAMTAGYTGFLLAQFEHLNVRTPRWLGYIISRPEMHAVHHQRGVHAYNYSLPLFDLLFGTFRNPATHTEPAGFYDGSSRPTLSMLLGRDISQKIS